ncbi:hypothetical protein HX886_01690, partial [Pseudomonas gingeri]|nr:hypothetical protein [Pseudomonas gingeri]NWC33376.1 hypothetical protein [Pseudomonas gingeri]
MPNLISTAEVELTLVDQFSAQGIGFPDQTMLNSDGKPDPSVLDKMLGMSRHLRRMEQAKVKPGARVMDFQRTSSGRLKLLIKDLYNAQQRLLNKTKKIDGYRSWERVIFNEIDSAWHDPAGKVTQRFDQLDPKDQETLDTMLHHRLDWVEKGKSWDIDLQDFINGRTYLKQLGGIVGILLDQLANWDELSSAQRRALADGAYAVATPFGNKLLGVFVTRQPDLMKHYTTLLADERKARQGGVIVQEDEVDEVECPIEQPSTSGTSSAPLSLYDLYTELFQLVQLAKTDAGNLCYAEQIESLITSNLPRLREEYSLSEDTIRKILGECINVLIQIGRELSLQDFEDDEFLSAFKAAWLEYFNERLKDEMPESFLADLTEEKEANSVEIKARLAETEALCAQIESDLAGFTEKLKVANFREKGELRSSITEAEESRARNNRQHQEVEQQGLDLLLPPGYQLEMLSADGEEFALTPQAFHPSAKVALKAWKNTLSDDQVNDPLCSGLMKP